MKIIGFFNNTNFTNINGKIFLKKEFKIKTTVTSSQIREGFLTLKLFPYGTYIHLLECLKKQVFLQISIVTSL